MSVAPFPAAVAAAAVAPTISQAGVFAARWPARGLARALTGNLDGARADFEARLDSPWIASPERRREWIAALARGENPFTPEVVEDLSGR